MFLPPHNDAIKNEFALNKDHIRKFSLPDFSDFFRRGGKQNHVTKLHENLTKEQRPTEQQRLTPEVVEPRTSLFESESELKKKVKPCIRNGKVESLPPFNTFHNLVNGDSCGVPRLVQTKGVNNRKKAPNVKNKFVDEKLIPECGCTRKFLKFPFIILIYSQEFCQNKF